LNISFLLVIGETGTEKRSKPKFALFVVMICTDRPNSKKLKRILNHVQLFTGGELKAGDLPPETSRTLM